MKHYSKLTRSGRWCLLLTLALAIGVGQAWAQKALPYSYGFEDNNLATDGWTTHYLGTNTTNNSTDFKIISTAGTYRTGSYGFQFSSYTKDDNNTYDQYLISPEISAPNGVTVEFYYKVSSSSTSGEKFKVGYSTTDATYSSFTFDGEEIAAKNYNNWEKFSCEFPAGTKYIAIHYYPSYQYRLYVDDFTLTAVELYKKPTDFASTGYTATTASFSWTNGSEETAWQIAYSTTSGFDADAATPVSVTTKPYTLEGLTAETTYYARIRADYGSGNYSKWSDEISFKPSAALNTTINDGSSTTTGYQAIPFHTYYTDGTSDKSQFIIPSATLSAVADRQITKLTFHSQTASASFGATIFKIYLQETDATSFDAVTFDHSDMEEVYSGSVSIVNNEMVITLDEPFDYGNGNLKVGFEMTTKGTAPSTCSWYGITSATNTSIYHYQYGSSPNSGLSSFLPKMTITSLPQTTTVKKPKNLAASEVATTTATLGWTNGGDETAWQIAYSTDTDFDPDTEGTKVAATANPYTLSELTAATTYYAYVRAEKAGEYSAWSNKVEFTTLSAAPVITLSTTSHNFGLVSDADAQALTLTITNDGGAALTGLSVTASSGFAVTDAEGNALTATTIAASSSLTIKVKVNALGQQDGTITINGTEIDEQTVTVSGYMLDNTKICETFTSAVPTHWTEYAYKSGYSTYTWNYSAEGAYNSNENSTLTTPKLTVGESETLLVYAKLKSSATYGYLTIEGSADNGETWTYTKKLDYEAFNSTTGTYQLITLSDVPTTVNKLRFKCYYAYLNAINGFTYAADPVLALYSNEACTTTQASPATKNFGFVTESQEQKYYIKNTGTGQIDLTITQADGFTATVDDAALTENEVATLTITMAATEGLHDGTLTVTAKNHDTDEELGTFEVALNGAVAGSKNDVNFASLSDVPAGWDKGSWTVTANSYVQNNSGTANDMTTATFTVAEGETMLVEAQGSSSYYAPTLTYSYKAGDADWTEAVSIGTVTYNNWKVYAITGIPAGEAKVKFSGTYIRIRRIYGFTAKVEPFMVFAAEGITKNFGMVTANTTSDAYTITNSGTATLENLSVTCDNSNFEIAVADAANEIAANGGTATFTVTLKNTVKGSQTGTVTISGTGVADKTFTVKGYVADDTKIFTTFAALPDRWTNTGNYWSFSASGATATSSSSKLETPKIVVAEGQKLAISAMQRYSGSSYYVTINGSSDNGATWTAYTKTLNNEQLNNTDYTVVELDDIPTTVNKLQLVGYYVYVNGLNGFTYDENDPKFAVYSDSEFSSEFTSGSATNAWGFVTEDKTATYYIKNTGTGTMTLTKTDAPAGFTATLGATSLGTGESTTLTISMANNSETNEGYHAGSVVLTAKDNAENTLGTFTVTSSGVVVSASKTDINFTTLSDVPAGWEKGNWTVTANTKVAVGYSSGSMTTGTYTVVAGESMVIKAKKQYSSGTLSYQYCTDGGETWSTAQSITPSSTSYEIVAISDIPAGSAKIKFTGTYIDIERIYGYTAVLEPVMTLSPAAASYDFGMQTAAADYEMTVTNSGTATMTGLTATLTGDDAADYEVALSIPDGSTATITENVATVPVGQTVKVTATLKASTEYKDHTATLTISATYLAAKAITLSGKTRDASKWYVDFASEIPSSFVEKGSWSVSSGAAYSGSGESSLISQPIDLAAGEKIYFDAKKPSYGSPSLKVRYSVNGGISWSDYVDYAAAISSSAYSTHEIDLGNDAAVTAIVEFKGYYYMYLDNIYGGTLNNTASMISVKESTTAVESGVTKAFGSIKAEATATYTIKNIGQGTLTITSPVTTTGVATAAVNATSLGSGESATLTITMPVAAPYEYKEGAVTLETSLGNFVINYNATVLNPNALDEQFASGKPAGWYFEGYWKVSSAQAIQEDTATPQDLITEQLSVAGTSDVLTFQAARTSSSSAPTFNVYTSQDRVTWTPVDLSSLTLTTSYQDVTISGLAAGDYYVKISGARVKVDNFLGWTKKNNTRDLYVTSSTFPTSTDKGKSATISATVTSLIAAETGVYAKLFINDAEEATVDAQDISLNGTQTFSFTYAIPENKTAQIKIYYSDGTEAFATDTANMKVSYALSEEENPGTITAGTFNLTLSRAFNAESWNSLCLPFAVADVSAFFGEGSYAYAFTDYEDGTLNFTKVEALTAGTPYIVYVKDEKSDAFTQNDVTLISAASTTEQNGVVFRGTFAPIAAGGFTATGTAYGLTPEAKIAPLGESATSNGFRAYFDIPTSASVKALVFNDGLATSVKALDIDTPETQRIFDLAGRKLNETRKGVNIINGKKVLIK